MSEPRPNLRISLASRPENVALLREALAGVAESVELGAALEDIKSAVSEAANNVVVHAYGDGEGPMELELTLGPDELFAVVRDHGAGIAPRLVGPGDDGRGIGLAVIEALAGRMELRAHVRPGLEVAMWFPIPEHHTLPGLHDPSLLPAACGDRAAVEMAIAPTALSAPLIGRVLVALGARAGFSIDRLSDVQLVADALAAHLGGALDGSGLALGASTERRQLELRVGPLRTGGSRGIVADSAIADLGPVIERLVDRVDVCPDGSHEHLVLTITDARRAGEVRR